MHYFEMLTSESLSSEDEMDCDNIRLVAANQFRAADNETDNSSSEPGEDNTAVDTSCGDVVDCKWEKSLVALMCHPFTCVSGIAPNLNLDNDSSRAAIFLLYLNDNIFYKLCDSANSYICDFKIFVEKDKTDGTPASTAIVMEMMQKFRTNRKHMPKELPKEKLKVGEAVAYSSSINITSMKWKDKREVRMLSTKHTLDFTETGKVHRKMQTKIMKSTAVLDYNIKIRGVDVGDQILSKFLVMRRYSKAYKKIFFYVVDMMLLNSYVLFKKLHGKDIMFHVFKENLAEDLLESYLRGCGQEKVCDIGDLPSRLSGRHFPGKLAPSAAKGSKFAKRCVGYLEKKQRG
ncbi:hypothetical protein PR048_023188 [Dryococelus australis]|uniref:PiggyBac transposable element-derived protein domain-containing protein n=1 Tax=Dryococelus australis TaxID=614101 RepID=A0ABQ9GTE3_9NEOP|nr:hypothetical protein PR048_023188 [Dryococelus australis]